MQNRVRCDSVGRAGNASSGYRIHILNQAALSLGRFIADGPLDRALIESQR